MGMLMLKNDALIKAKEFDNRANNCLSAVVNTGESPMISSSLAEAISVDSALIESTSLLGIKSA
jgi:hypothetical protein